MTPSSLPLCASIGPRTTVADGPDVAGAGAAVSSTLMKPRSSSATPVPSASRSFVNGRRPIATTTLVDDERSARRSHPVAERARRPCSTLAPVTLAPSRMSRPCFLKCCSASFASVLVGHRQELLERLEHDDFGAEAAPDAAEFEPDHARADHAEPLRHGLELERAPGIDDVLAVERRRHAAPSAPSRRRARRASPAASSCVPSVPVNSTVRRRAACRGPAAP